MDLRRWSHPNLETEKVNDHVQSHWQIPNMLKRMERCYEQNAFGNITHQSKSCFPLRPNHDALHLHRKTSKSYLDVVSQSRRCNKREPAKFIGDGRAFLLANHEQIHTEIKCKQIWKIENAHECTKCGKAFIKKCWLNERKRIHTGKKHHGCSVCGKTFSKKFKLTKHQRTHKEEKPHVCSEYGKIFFRKFQLTEQKTPMGNKPHVCSVCSKVFFRKFKLIEYQRTHTGEKPYEWTECAKPSVRRQSYVTSAKQKRRKTPCVQWARERFLQKVVLVLH